MSKTSELTLGIDLGNSFSSAAVRFNGQTYFVPDRRGEPCIPSVVYFPRQGAPVVGAYALRMRQYEPGHTVSGIKRILGRRFDSPEVRLLQAHSAVTVAKSPQGEPLLRTHASDHSPIEIASLIFRHLRNLAENRFRTPVRKAVLTLPACATPEVEHATVQAARSAGLDVLRTITEPHAAALAAELDRPEAYRHLLVYDFGGGTFDVTALDQNGGQFLPLSLGGDGCLGGDDFDHAMAELASAHIWKTTKVELSNDIERWERLVHEAEQTKRALSARDVAPLRMKDAYSHRGKDRDIDLLIHRSDIGPRWSPLLERSLAVTAQTLLVAGLKPRDVGCTLLVGGTTFVPAVRQAVVKLMGSGVIQHVRPQTAVAEGAAIAAVRALAQAA